MRYIIVGEPDPQRFRTVENVIKSEFDLDVKQAATRDEVFEHRKKMRSDLAIVLLTDNFAQGFPISKSFDQVWEPGAVLGYLYDPPMPRLDDMVSPPQQFLPFPVDDASRQTLITGLESTAYLQRLRKISVDKDDPLLIAQIRSLDRDRNLQNGLRLLRVLVLGFFLDDFTVYRVRSGRSGASVFKIVLGNTREYMLKLGTNHWKLAIEASKHDDVTAGISIRQSKPQIQRPRASSSGYVFTGIGGFSAICFTFLGGPTFGTALDLQAILTTRPKHLMPTDDLARFRKDQLSALAKWLKQTWCANQPAACRLEARPWDPAPPKEQRSYPTFPPYTLTDQAKNWILEFLESTEAEIGSRLLGSRWIELSQRIKRFVEIDQTTYGVPLLDDPISVVHSPAHGDLNANNVLYFHKFVDPIFLIDFPMYQQRGHALQDFARLETEIKYALLDRQEDSDAAALPGLDFSPQQFRLWCELEDHLRESWTNVRVWKAPGYSANMDLALELIQILRHAAREVQQNALNAPPSVDFASEYSLPLLYHTLRAITYPSLSPFKRILALYSSAQLLGQLGFI